MRFFGKTVADMQSAIRETQASITGLPTRKYYEGKLEAAITRIKLLKVKSEAVQELRRQGWSKRSTRVAVPMTDADWKIVWQPLTAQELEDMDKDVQYYRTVVAFGEQVHEARADGTYDPEHFERLGAEQGIRRRDVNRVLGRA